MLAGVIQTLKLDLETGGHTVQEGDTINIRGSEGVILLDTTHMKQGCLTLPAIETHQIHQCEILLFVEIQACSVIKKQVCNCNQSNIDSNFKFNYYYLGYNHIRLQFGLL